MWKIFDMTLALACYALLIYFVMHYDSGTATVRFGLGTTAVLLTCLLVAALRISLRG